LAGRTGDCRYPYAWTHDGVHGPYRRKNQGQGRTWRQAHQTVRCISIAAHAISTLQTVISVRSTPWNRLSSRSARLRAIGLQRHCGRGRIRGDGSRGESGRPAVRRQANRRDSQGRGEIHARPSVSASIISAYPPLYNNPEFTELFGRIAGHDRRARNIFAKSIGLPWGGEDMAYFLNETPGTFSIFRLPT